MMKVRFKTKFTEPIYAYPKDTLTLLYRDKTGMEHNLGTMPIGRDLVLEGAIIFDIDGELGFKQGIGGVVGELKKEEK